MNVRIFKTTWLAVCGSLLLSLGSRLARAEISAVPYPTDTAKAIADARKKWGFTPGRLYWEEVSKRRVDAALAANDPRALGDLMNTRYRRDEVIAVLRTYLDHPSAKVRFDAAKELFMLGSDAGREVMAALLQAAALGKQDAQPLADWAANILHQYHQPIDAKILLTAYGKTMSSTLKQVIVLEQLPEAKIIASAALQANTLEDHATRVGILHMDDPATLAKMRAMSESSQPYRQMTARWALAQTTGSEADLAYVINLAKQTANLAPRPSTYDNALALDALRLLTITAAPQAKDALREIVTQTSTGEYLSTKRDDVVFDTAFAALYYIHQDYSFVDQKISELLNAPKSQPDFALVWQIAAKRHTPELELQALNRRPGSYEEYFIRQRDRPEEYWIYQYIGSIPASLQPKSKP